MLFFALVPRLTKQHMLLTFLSSVALAKEDYGFASVPPFWASSSPVPSLRIKGFTVFFIISSVSSFFAGKIRPAISKILRYNTLACPQDLTGTRLVKRMNTETGIFRFPPSSLLSGEHRYFPDHLPQLPPGAAPEGKKMVRATTRLARQCEHAVFRLWSGEIQVDPQALTAAAVVRERVSPYFRGQHDPYQITSGLRRLCARLGPDEVNSPGDIGQPKDSAITALLEQTDAFFGTEIRPEYVGLATDPAADLLTHFPVLACLALDSLAHSPRPSFLAGNSQIIPDVTGDHIQLDAVRLNGSVQLPTSPTIHDIFRANRPWETIEIKALFSRDHFLSLGKLKKPATPHSIQVRVSLARAALIALTDHPETSFPFPQSYHIYYLRPFGPPVHHRVSVNRSLLSNWLSRPDGFGVLDVLEGARCLKEDERAPIEEAVGEFAALLTAWVAILDERALAEQEQVISQLQGDITNGLHQLTLPEA